MRKSLFLAAAMAPLCMAPAKAASIDSSTTTPVATSTADSGAAGDVTITSSGSISGVGTTPAVTLDSSNTVTNEGTLQVGNVDGSTGVLIQGGNTGSFTNSGTISLFEDYTPPDANSDGVLEAPYATGTNRVGVRLSGSSAFVGDIVNSGAIAVEGMNSSGMSIEGPLQGSLVSSGTISVTGDRSSGISISAPVAGVVRIQGSISYQGLDASAIETTADIGGSLAVYSTVAGTGYGLTSRPSLDSSLTTIQGVASQVEQSAAAIHVGGDLGQGLYIGSPPPGTTTDTTDDNDGDGLADNSVGTGAVISYGSAPAILVGSSTRDVGLGLFGTGDNAYGVIVRGSVTGSGVYDGVSATGMQIGGLGGAVNVAGGIKIFGVVSADSYDAAATGLKLGSGALVPELRVENTLAASIAHSTVSTTTATATATALQVDAGASLSTLTNPGTISAAAVGDGVSASAVVDQSGSITTVINQGTISASVTPATTGLSVAGKAIALDLRANTTGVTLVQNVNPSPILLSRTTSGSTTVDVTTTSTPLISGDILLGSGPNTVTVDGGAINGALDLGSGASTLTINNGATYQGDLRHTGSDLAVAVNAGNLISSHVGILDATSLTVGATGVLSLAVDPQAGASGGFKVSGPAVFADGSKIGVTLSSILTQSQTFTLISAGSLSVGPNGAELLGSTPYVVVAGLRTDVAAGTISLDLRRRTAAEIGFNATEGAAYDAIYNALGLDSEIQTAVLGQTSQGGFLGLYRQLLPDYAGGMFRLARAGAEASSRAAAEIDVSPGSLWVQEAAFGVSSFQEDASAYQGGGFALMAGIDGPEGVLGRLGASLSFITGGVTNPDTPGDNLQSFTEFEGSLYWRLHAGGLRIDAHGSGGPVWFKSRREFIQTDSEGDTVVDRTAEGDSNGYALAGRVSVGYEFEGGILSVRPQTRLEYFRLKQGGYGETGGGDGFDLTLSDRTGSSTTVTTSLVFGPPTRALGLIQPSLELGYRYGLSGSAGGAVAQFSGGDAFTLLSPSIKGEGAAIGRASLRSSSDYFDLSLSAGFAARSDYVEGDLQFRARISF